MTSHFTKAERAVLSIVQDNLPDSLTPYADIAEKTGMAEADVIALLKRLKQSGAIRRFGASIRHQRAGWTSNAMVAWKATREEAERCGPIAAQHPNISHAYYRPGSAPDWPYTLYTMVHGRSEAEVSGVIEQLLQSWPLKEYVVLRSIRELKKTSMIYFPEESANG